MATEIWVTIGLANDCLPDGNKPLLISYWLLISAVLWHSPQRNYGVSTQTTILYNEFENHIFKITATSPRGRWANSFFDYLKRLLLKRIIEFEKSCIELSYIGSFIDYQTIVWIKKLKTCKIENKPDQFSLNIIENYDNDFWIHI